MIVRVLIVEDNDYKCQKIIEVIKNSFSNISLDICRSFTSGWQKIRNEDFDLICLDMSLPTFDISGSESGGEFRTFGGKELVSKMVRRRPNLRFLIITQYESFSLKNNSYTFDSLKSEIQNDYNDACKGFVLFSNKSSDWKLNLKDAIEGVGGEYINR
jgi:CheY-like chemotaxis protein